MVLQAYRNFKRQCFEWVLRQPKKKQASIHQILIGIIVGGMFVAIPANLNYQAEKAQHSLHHYDCAWAEPLLQAKYEVGMRLRNTLDSLDDVDVPETQKKSEKSDKK